MFSPTPMVDQDCVAVGRVDEHPGDRAGALAGVEHPDLEVGEVDLRQLRVALADGGAHARRRAR